MTIPKKIENPVETIEDLFIRAIHRFSTSLCDLREFSELVESLIKTHKMKELEAVLARYDGLGEALCHFDSSLKSQIKSIQESSNKTADGCNSSLKIEFDYDKDGDKILRAAGFKDDIKEFDKQISSVFKTENSVQHLHRSSLISLVSIVESFISRVLHLFYQKHPSALNSKEKQFTFEELSTFSSLEDARAYLVSWKIENILRGSYEDWLEYFRNNVKLELSIAAKHHDRLIEIFQRRNLFVHNDGIVNKIYLSKVSKTLTKPEMLDKRLGVSKEYLFSAIDRFESSFLQLAFDVWAKCDKSSEKRPTIIVQSTYAALQSKRWKVVTDLAEVVDKDKSASEVDILMARFNSWIARKNMEDKEVIFEEIRKFDVSAKDDLFKLAKYCLLEDESNTLIYAKQLEKTGKISLTDLNEWPLFEYARAQPKMASWLSDLKKKSDSRKNRVIKNTKAIAKPNLKANVAESSEKEQPKPKRTKPVSQADA